MGLTGKGIPTPEDSVKISGLAAAIRAALAKVDELLTASNPFAGTQLSLTADANTMRTTGWYFNRYGSDAANMVNFPVKESFHFHVWSTSNGVTYQLHVGTGSTANMWVRFTGSVTSGTWTPWHPLKDPVPKPVAPAAHRSMLVSAFKARRGGTIGTSGRAAVALRFDHGLANFEIYVLPLLRKYNLPWAQTINSGLMGSTDNASSFAEFQGWAINDGGTVSNHGRDHISADDPVGIDNQILGPLDAFKANMPALVCEEWDPPGVQTGDFLGYSPMQTLDQHWNTYAGQLVIANHAAVAGYLPGLYRPLPANLEIGLGHTTIDAQTPAWVDGVLRGAIDAKAGLKIMFHPVYINQAGYMTTADLDAVFANIAARRDAGEIEVLTPSALLLADPRSTYRHDLITNGRFRNALTSWGNTTGWTVTTTGPLPYASTSTGTLLTQIVSMARKEALLGGVREIVYRVRATTGAVVRTAVTGSGLNATKDHTLPASTNWVEVRKPLTIPANLLGDLTAAVGRVSGGTVQITDIRLRSI